MEDQKLIYIDTSVVGGIFDVEFQLWSKMFFEQVKNGKFRVAVSELLIEELKPAREHIRDFIFTLPKDQVLVARYEDDARALADK